MHDRVIVHLLLYDGSSFIDFENWIQNLEKTTVTNVMENHYPPQYYLPIKEYLLLSFSNVARKAHAALDIMPGFNVLSAPGDSWDGLGLPLYDFPVCIELPVTLWLDFPGLVCKLVTGLAD